MGIIAYQPMLVAFDFDGTLSDDEMIILLAERAGCAEEVIGITDRAMEGELSFAESLRQRVALLEGLTESEASAAFNDVALRPGAAMVISGLNAVGVSTVILTGGFEMGVERALDGAGVEVDEVVANQLVAEEGRLTGAVTGPLIEERKDVALRRAAEARGFALGDTIAVGDGANDVPMLDVAGTAIGFRPKSKVVPHCDIVVATMDRLYQVLVDSGILTP